MSIKEVLHKPQHSQNTMTLRARQITATLIMHTHLFR